MLRLARLAWPPSRCRIVIAVIFAAREAAGRGVGGSLLFFAVHLLVLSKDHTTMNPSAAIVGAGAIGAWIGDALDRAGWAVSMLARGPTLAALRSGGLIVERDGEGRHSRPRAGSPPDLGIHDYVFLTV